MTLYIVLAIIAVTMGTVAYLALHQDHKDRKGHS
jgi:hypothetical protein